MQLMIDSLLLWPLNSKNTIQKIDFKKDKLNFIHGISGTGKSAIIPIIDYCLGSSKCAIPVGIIRDSVQWFGIIIDIKGEKYIIARETPNNKSANNRFYFEHYTNVLPIKLKANYNLETIKSKFNNFSNLSDLTFAEKDTPIGFDGKASYRDIAAFNFLPQHIVANPYALFFKADTYNNREKLKKVLPVALGIHDREYMKNKKECEILTAELEKLQRKKQAKQIHLESRRFDIERLWNKCIENGWLSTPSGDSSEIPLSAKIENLKSIYDLYKQDNLDFLKHKSNYFYTNDEYNRLIKQESEIQKELFDLRITLENYEQLFFKGQDFALAVQTEKNHLTDFEWLKNNLLPNGKCIACGEETGFLSTVVNNLETKVSEINTLSNALFNNPIIDNSSIELKKKITDKTTILSEVRRKKNDIIDSNKIDGDSFKQIFILLGRIEEALTYLNKINVNNDIDNRIRELKQKIHILENYLSNPTIKNHQFKTYSRINSFIQFYASQFQLEKHEKVKLDPKELTLSFDLTNDSRKKEYLWEVGSGANWMGYHISAFLAIHQFLSTSEKMNLPPFSFIVIDQPSQVYFPSTSSGENLLDQLNIDNLSTQLVTQNDISATKKIFEVLSSALQRSNFNFQIIVLEHADKSIWGDIEDTYEAACWKEQGNGLIPKEWL